MNQEFADLSIKLEHIALEFELAAKHSRIAALHVSNGEVPRFAAHLLAAQGHSCDATRKIE